MKIIDDIYWWFAHRFCNRHKYNCVDMGKTLKPGYYEIETRMLHALFTLLSDYVEREMDIVTWDETLEDVRLKTEIDYLYSWWKIVYPNYEKNDPLYGVSSLSKEFHEKCLESFYYERIVESQIEEHMIRLIRLRRILWS